MKTRIATILISTVILALMTSCGGGGGTGSIGAGASAPSLVSIEVTPADPVIALGTETQMKATGIYSDNSKKDLTETIEWYSSDDSVVTVSRGLAMSRGRGSAVVRVQSGTVSGNRPLTVTDAALVSIQVTPVNPEAPLGTNRQFTATGIFSDGSAQDLTQQVNWGAADGSVASVSNETGTRGIATALATGATAVSAELDGVTGSTGLTVTAAVLVSIQVTPATPGLPRGTTLQLTATGVYSDHSTQDLTRQVTWGSSDPSVASVSSAAGANGLARALAVGSATASASLDGVTGSTALTVTEAALVSIHISAEPPSLARGTNLQLTATGTYTDDSARDITRDVTWGASDPSVAFVSNAAGSNGLAAALGVGRTSVSAALDGVTGTTALEVTAVVLVAVQVNPADPVVAMDVIQEFTATGIYSDGSTQDLTLQATWSSSDNRVAVISNADGDRGFATPVGFGTSEICATRDGIQGSTTLTVSNATLVSIEVTPDGKVIRSGDTLQYTATGYYSDGMSLDITNSAAWKSSDNKVVKVANAKKRRGLATGDDAGKATVTATLSKISGAAALTVTP
ncbi:MAG TPA: Ig-like domain-containing protein [Syntrophales bacterium]|nr:Ig-like domain-containing protein [Syntrophales bacterium]